MMEVVIGVDVKDEVLAGVFNKLQRDA